jgi:hypothetical protein
MLFYILDCKFLLSTFLSLSSILRNSRDLELTILHPKQVLGPKKSEKLGFMVSKGSMHEKVKVVTN